MEDMGSLGTRGKHPHNCYRSSRIALACLQALRASDGPTFPLFMGMPHPSHSCSPTKCSHSFIMRIKRSGWLQSVGPLVLLPSSGPPCEAQSSFGFILTCLHRRFQRQCHWASMAMGQPFLPTTRSTPSPSTRSSAVAPPFKKGS